MFNTTNYDLLEINTVLARITLQHLINPEIRFLLHT